MYLGGAASRPRTGAKRFSIQASHAVTRSGRRPSLFRDIASDVLAHPTKTWSRSRKSFPRCCTDKKSPLHFDFTLSIHEKGMDVAGMGNTVPPISHHPQPSSARARVPFREVSDPLTPAQPSQRRPSLFQGWTMGISKRSGNYRSRLNMGLPGCGPDREFPLRFDPSPAQP